jgi:hypothetical protein
MASYGCPTPAGERHARSYTPVGEVASTLRAVCHGVHPARLGAVGALGHRDGVVLGGAYHHANLDGIGLGGALARAGALCGVWRLGPRRGGTAAAAGDGAGTAGPVGPLPPGGRG